MHKTADDEQADLLNTLMFTVGIIRYGNRTERQRISNAFKDALVFISTGKTLATSSSRSLIMACFERHTAYKAAGDVAAAGWMLAAIRERILEHDLRDWKKLEAIIDLVIQVLPEPGKTALH